MKIVILDSETVTRNDVSLEGITSLGDTEVFGYTPNESVAEHIGDADAVICNKCLIIMSIFVIVIIMEHEVSGCLPSFRGFGLIEGRNAYEEKGLCN